ncbi:MAG TPA: multifunctional oxoglutarate decarboxylase/oxoglutarate dehydrogenase thiamine pyrophosphate-binding subunit/dihydrolipoyllysine-residue succinyltransferase subunit [Acidimicrobiales bacterium]|nr:multifunctional oxoglutarate decarboxylase/oxoglutarate dehydrogenase thiamine pyrophosphate-binding subunit/dihydrolipoyllysine-residue succinyltransferase subunit [Acidimicrobiales bacterium]
MTDAAGIEHVVGNDGDGARPAGGSFGPNAWLVDDMYERYVADPDSVGESWREFFADYRPAPVPASPAVAPASPAPTGNGAATAVAAPPERPAPAPAPPGTTAAPAGEPVEQPEALRGAASRIVANMEASLGVPTATSVRTVPAKLLEVNRAVLNNQLAKTTGAKVSFTHLIGYAVVRALVEVPALNATFVASIDEKGTPGIVRHRHVGLGLAVDVQRAGGRTLLVPCVRQADTLDFRSFVLAYEELVRKVHANKVGPDDFAGTTVTLTNPGTIGTVQSVPRLMPGQGAIIGVGALGHPAGFEATDPRVLAELGIGKVVTLTSTYDHRIIQGAESGLFLARVSELLEGRHGFYDEVFASMSVPYEPVRWKTDVNAGDDPAELEHQRLVKQVHVQTLINMYRVRGHLMAHLDPLDVVPPRIHPELDPLTYGLTIWDLPRHFVADGLAGRDTATLEEILDLLRDAYCQTLGIEYMHIQDPEQKRWIQQHVEGVPTGISPDEQRHILDRLNAAEVFERFLHTRYVGQKRFGLEGAESTIVVLDTVLDAAAGAGTAEVVMGMAHRGRLNVLANIVGKSYREIFEEFEGNLDPDSVQGSGDVKYHKGAMGKFTGRSGAELPVTMASNPSHLEAVDPVVEGMARAKQDRILAPTDGTPDAVVKTDVDFPVLALLVHGDAAFAGQGVVAETLNLSGLSGYRTGGTVHLVINNQLGFTTAPEAARTSVYPTDVAKMVQAPIFHVNGDDPEACVRAARLALGFRDTFKKDVVIDLVCYRRHGHNEGDDPSYTQPLMYQRIENKRSVRKLYTEVLVRRGDITLEEAEQSLDDFNARLQSALDEVRAEAPEAPPTLRPEPPAPVVPAVATGVPEAELATLASATHATPPGFTLHPKLGRQFAQRDEMVAAGWVDWALAEALAVGSLLEEGVDVRLTGQDTRRGTFSQRHAVLVDYVDGREYVPLAHLDETVGPAARAGADGSRLGRFTVRDSLLSEYAAVGFEYGYSVEAPDDLVCWEAQFGDFVNVAEVILDNFLVAAEDKWGQMAGLVLLLPHGYEGQGPEHSSARIERFLSLAARGNLRVAQPSTAAQYFHLLRSQVKRARTTPLVVITPKSLLRAPATRSPLGALTEGSFAEVIDDPGVTDPVAVRRVVLASGKVAHEALARRDMRRAGEGPEPVDGPVESVPPEAVAVVRVEQLYPWPEQAIGQTLARYPEATEVVWLQEEPENMGAWSFVHARLHKLLRQQYRLRHVSRAESASPATGSAALHLLEQADLLDRAVG